MKILYAAGLAPGRSSLYRLWALRRAGHTVIECNTLPYRPANNLLHKLAFRAASGPDASRLNRDLLTLAERERPQIFWADKTLLLAPSTLQAMRRMGIATVSYMIDNAFGPRRDPGWRRYLQCLPEFDLHVTQRDVSLEDYRQRGARDVLKVLLGFEPTMHFPPPENWNDANRDRGVSFIGMPYDDRAGILAAASKAGLPIVVSGPAAAWQRKPEAAAFFREGELLDEAYREGIWRSRINLAFITHSNLDEVAHKSFEIAACGGFLLAERSPGHERLFAEDEEAVFFSSPEQLIAKATHYLADEPARARIAAAGRARAQSSGYANDVQVAAVLNRLVPGR